ncbi:MAG: WXG100 family type VII secretion target [Nocardiopsaceae bacterium]|nr:WXG100 family type VII secretion target [Nocardiopsaceae bacterium]
MKRLNDSVDALVHAAGWQGQAAEAFKNAWELDSAEAVALVKLMDSGGDILDSLALKLAWIQNEWESLDPDPQKAYKKGRESAKAKIAQAVDTAVQDLNGLSGGKLASIARRDIKDGTIPAAQRKTLDNWLRDSLGGLPQRPSSGKPGPGTDTRISKSHTEKDATVGGLFGGMVGTAVGGALGLLGGPFDPITVPTGVGVGGSIGTLVGGAIGSLWGIGEDLHFW